jgi:hypothetical protein
MVHPDTGVLAVHSARTAVRNRTSADGNRHLFEVDCNQADDAEILSILDALDFEPRASDDTDCGLHYLCEECLDSGSHGTFHDQCLPCAVEEAACLECRVLRGEASLPTAESSAGGLTWPFIDAAAVLSGGLTAPAPTIGRRTDDAHLFYRSAVNVVVGDPESGKSLLARSVAADVLFEGGSAIWLDLDHNGAAAIMAGFRAWGVPVEVLANPSRFLLAVVDDQAQMDTIIAYAVSAGHVPDLLVMDSIGELVGLYGGDQNSDTDYTRINRATTARAASAGSCVIAIDHLAKGADSRAYGASGSVAKKRAVDGAMYRVELSRPFVPKEGGKAKLLLVKDRHGGVREASPSGDRTPLAATFEIPAGPAVHWRFWAPGTSSSEAREGEPLEGSRSELPRDVQVLAELSPAPTSKRDVMSRTGWGSDRAATALRLWRSVEES